MFILRFFLERIKAYIKLAEVFLLSQGLPDLIDLSSELADLNEEIADVSYVADWRPTSKDVELFNACKHFTKGKLSNLPHFKRWYNHLKSYSDNERLAFPQPPKISISSSLIEKVDRLTNCGNSDPKTIEKKVRQPINASTAATDHNFHIMYLNLCLIINFLNIY